MKTLLLTTLLVATSVATASEDRFENIRQPYRWTNWHYGCICSRRLSSKMNSRLLPKITQLFDILERDMDVGDYQAADVTLARLSKYFHLFDDEHADFYQYAQNVVEEVLHGSGEVPCYFDDFADGDNYLTDWDGDALSSAGFGTDESY